MKRRPVSSVLTLSGFILISGLVFFQLTPEKKAAAQCGLTQSLFIKYTGNPVLTFGTLQNSGDPTIIYEVYPSGSSPPYHMWYTGGICPCPPQSCLDNPSTCSPECQPANRRAKIYVATSYDGFTFIPNETTPVLAPGDNLNDWDGWGVETPFVVNGNGAYYMFYNAAKRDVNYNKIAGTDRIGVAKCVSSTPDCPTWTKVGTTPILAGTVDFQALEPSVLYEPGNPGKFRLWYWDGSTGITYRETPDTNVLTGWNGGANPTLTYPFVNNNPSQVVIKRSTGIRPYEMYLNNPSGVKDGTNWKVTSTTGLDFTCPNNPPPVQVLGRGPQDPLGIGGSYDSEFATAPAAFVGANGQLMLYYSAWNGPTTPPLPRPCLSGSCGGNPTDPTQPQHSMALAIGP